MPVIKKTVELDPFDVYALQDVIDTLNDLWVFGRDNQLPALQRRVCQHAQTLARVARGLDSFLDLEALFKTDGEQ